MERKWIVLFGSAVLVISIVIAGASFADSDHSKVSNGTIQIGNQAETDFPYMATINQSQAIDYALSSVNGRVLKTELENENGFLVYGIEVVTNEKVIVDVKVDAGSGKVLAMDRDKPEANDRESDDNENEDREHED